MQKLEKLGKFLLSEEVVHNQGVDDRIRLQFANLTTVDQSNRLLHKIFVDFLNISLGSLDLHFARSIGRTY